MGSKFVGSSLQFPAADPETATVIEAAPATEPATADAGADTVAPIAVVIGAGPYGLAVAAHLRGAGVTTRVFGEPMESWRSHMPVGMFLKSEPSASSISAPEPGYRLEDYCRSIGVRPLRDDEAVPIDLFVAYGRWFQTQLVPVEPARVASVSTASDGFDVAVDTGERITTRNVVVATGHVRHARVPAALRGLAGDGSGPPLVSHTCDHADLSRFAGSSVAVVGAGQSALESAALLREAGAEPHLIVREAKVLWAGPPEPEPRPLRHRLLKPGSPLGPGWSHVASQRGAFAVRFLPERARLRLLKIILGPAGAWWLHDRVDGVVDVRTSTEIVSATARAGRVDLSLRTATGTASLTVDHVLAATGYSVDLDRLDFLDPALRETITRVDGFPALHAGFESSVPGLYFAGLSSAATFGPMMRFVCGTDFAAPRLAAAVAARG